MSIQSTGGMSYALTGDWYLVTPSGHTHDTLSIKYISGDTLAYFLPPDSAQAIPFQQWRWDDSTHTTGKFVYVKLGTQARKDSTGFTFNWGSTPYVLSLKLFGDSLGGSALGFIEHNDSLQKVQNGDSIFYWHYDTVKYFVGFLRASE